MEDLGLYKKKFNDLVELVPLLYDKKIPDSIERLLTACKVFNSSLDKVEYLIELTVEDLNKADLNDRQTLFQTLPEQKENILDLLKNNTDLYNAVESYDYKIRTMSEELKKMESTKKKIDNLIKIETEEEESDWDDTAPPITVLSSITLKGGKKLRKTKRRKPTKKRRPKKIRRHTKRR